MNFEYGPADQEALERRNARAAAAVQMEQSLTPVALQHLEEQLRHPPPTALQETMDRHNAQALAALQMAQQVDVSDLEDKLRQTGRLPVLAEREATHGNFATTALIAQRFKDVSKSTPNWSGNLTDVQRETLEAIFTKIARILSGDPNHRDHWADIEGQARLASEQLP